MQGKLIRRSLKTDRISTAKLRLSDAEKQGRQKASGNSALTCGNTTFGNVLHVFKTQLEQSPLVKASTREYYASRIKALIKSSTARTARPATASGCKSVCIRSALFTGIKMKPPPYEVLLERSWH